MTTVSYQVYGVMDLNTSDDEMQMNSDMLGPDEVAFGEEDFMRDASVGADQDLMNQDPIDVEHTERDDDMVDEDVADHGSLIMADDVDVDVGRTMDVNPEDEDIIYEDEDEPIDLDDHEQTVRQPTEVEDHSTSENQIDAHVLDHSSLQDAEHLGRGEHSTKIDSQVFGEESQEGPGSRSTNTSTSFLPAADDTVNLTVESLNRTGNRVSLDTTGGQTHTESAIQIGDSRFDAANNSKPDEGSESYESNFDQANLGNYAKRESHIDNGSLDNENQIGQSDGQNTDTVTPTSVGKERADNITDRHNDVQGPELASVDVDVPQQSLHPVIVHYAQAEFSLFPPHEDDAIDFFVEDESLAFQGFDKLLASCRDVLEGSIGDHDEVVFDIPGLGLHISEGSIYANQISLAEVLDVYLTLRRNDQVDNVAPLSCELQTRVCLASQYIFLQQAAQSGKGASEIPNVLSALHSRPGIDETIPHDRVSTEDAQDRENAKENTQQENTRPNKRSSDNVESSVNVNASSARLTSTEQVHQDTSEDHARAATSHDAGRNGTDSVYRKTDLDVTHNEIEDTEAFKRANSVGERADEAEKDLGNDHVDQQLDLSSVRQDDNSNLVHDAYADANIDPQTHQVGLNVLIEDEKVPHSSRSGSPTPSNTDQKQFLSVDEDLFDDGNSKALKEPNNEHLHSEAISATELTEDNSATSKILSSDPQPNDHFANARESTKNAGEDDHRNKLEIANGEADLDENPVGSNEQNSLQIADKETESQEDELESFTGMGDEIEDYDEAPATGSHDKSTVAFEPFEIDPEETTLDVVDFDFVEPGVDGSFEEPGQQSNLSQSPEKGNFRSRNDSSLNSTPSSSKRKAHDTEDDAELIQSVTSETKRSRTS